MTISSKRLAMVLAVAVSGVALHQPSRVIDNPAPDFARPSLALAAKPTLVIDGNVDGDSLHELYNVLDALLTPTGSLIVVNNRGETIREYDRTGRFVRNISRKGAGPGEYRSISDLRALDGDTLVFYDGSQRRITVLGPDRLHVRTITGLHNPVCCAMNGRFADRENWPSAIGGRTWTAGSLKYAFGSIHANAAGAAPFAFSAEIDSVKMISLPGYAGSYVVTQEVAGAKFPIWYTYTVPFTMSPLVRFGVDELILATGERFEYQVRDGNGVLLRTVRAAAPLRPVTDAVIAAYRANGPRDATLAQKRLAAIDTLRLPKTLPAYDRLQVEEDGTVWLRDYVLADSLPRHWARFDRQGKLAGTMDLPANLSVLRFSRGHVIAAAVDTTVDFQRVAAYSIIRK